MEDITSSQSIITVVVVIITSITTIIVERMSQRVNKQIKTRQPRDVAGYERLLTYLERELQKQEDKIVELQVIIDRERENLKDEQRISEARRVLLLDLSRKYNVDVSAVV